MATLDVSLSAHTNSEDFGDYLVRLDPLQVSQSIHRGDEGESLGKAVDSWIELCELFAKVKDRDLPKILVLVEKWSSLSGQAFNQVLKDYTTWLIDFTEKIFHMERRIFDYYKAVFEAVVPPSAIINNRDKVLSLTKDNVVDLENGQIALLNIEYQGFRAQNIDAMRSYKAIASGELPLFQGPPEPNFRINFSVKSARQNGGTLIINDDSGSKPTSPKSRSRCVIS